MHKEENDVVYKRIIIVCINGYFNDNYGIFEYSLCHATSGAYSRKCWGDWTEVLDLHIITITGTALMIYLAPGGAYARISSDYIKNNSS